MPEDCGVLRFVGDVEQRTVEVVGDNDDGAVGGCLDGEGFGAAFDCDFVSQKQVVICVLACVVGEG